MSVVVMNRYIGGTPNEVVPIVKEWKEIIEKMARNRSNSANSLLARLSASGYSLFATPTGVPTQDTKMP